MRQAVVFAREQKIPRLLADSTQVTGFQRLDTLQFYNQGKALAEAAQGVVKVAMVAKEDWLEPQRIGVTVAQNRGMNFQIFTSEPEAMAWLLAPDVE